ncbi:pleckstrin homology domain-containing family F member 1 [Salminus brasiliensis]|uniref:pleckstrin homology domain-containing family F member 1 n=1 Tax=Salminus brasiliensis TaxID=930266 RepID=UPI003B838189
MMADHLHFTVENRERILAVESSFGPSGKSLLKPERVLVGEGRLMKLCRRRPQPKAFFLFNDILVYGSIVMAGRWHKNQQIIRLEEVEQEDLEDSLNMCNQWLIKTPRKSFYVSAASAEEKLAWMEHIESCRTQHLQRLGLPVNTPHTKDFAATWIPDHASAICMRCSNRFNITHRRHHCRRCGFIVCNSCSKARAVLRHISDKPVRVCMLCKSNLQGQERIECLHMQQTRKLAGNDWKTNSVEDTPEYEASSEEEEQQVASSAPTLWFENNSQYCYIRPEHAKPPRV